jgi:hypothetical protein
VTVWPAGALLVGAGLWGAGPVALAVVGLLLVLHAGVLAVVTLNRRHLAQSRTDVPPRAGTRAVVLVPARDEAANLRRLLPSLLAQTGIDWRAVVVDDASTDGTWDVLQQHRALAGGERLDAIRGTGPPPGWVGKVFALHTAAGRAVPPPDGEAPYGPDDAFVFLDADAELTDAGALARLVGRWQGHGGSGGGSGGVGLPPTALTGLPRYRDRGAAALLTSLVPFAVLSALPLPLVPLRPQASLSALNGQIWLLGAADYARLAPHAAHADEVLEDVQIGRYLKRNGVRLHFDDLSASVAVEMYRTFGEAWRGFRKNAYLIAGGTPRRFAIFFALYAVCWVVPSVAWAFAGPVGLLPLATLWLAKGLIDRWGRLPWGVTLAAPVALALGAALLLDSAWAHTRGNVAWKGRAVGGGEIGTEGTGRAGAP